MAGKEKYPVLSVEDLSKQIGKREIVRDIRFEVGQGEIFGFLGPNGAGKTTTIRMLVGLIRPTRGKVNIAGYDLKRDYLKAIRNVGCIVENPEMYPFLTGRENLEMFARMEGKVSPKRIKEVVELVEMDQRIDDAVKTYSLGMRQRLGIAQALLGEPQLLILDEPTNGLDPAGIREMRQFIQRLAREKGISIFISSHILHEVQRICDRVAIINRGTVIRTGPVSRLLEGDSPVQWRLDPPDQGMDILQSLSGVTTVERSTEHDILTHMPEEKISEANQRLLEAGVRVTAIRQQHPTLEDIFLQMTEEDPIA
ncbi:ABC transporter ATP-binding protein [Paludifilum halophilum]|uniref:ABC transporter ATP-binding protein n=1 Tax=Paludifilum halophilum TaxID=1642702 RepID=A0A235BCD3_9BACL|nr:ABC transporter ATP-binding protein [Paludifilum halophilum]OYD09920.1 ABC transporter ATP-binding protein [Paludifilum halophilum]